MKKSFFVLSFLVLNIILFKSVEAQQNKPTSNNPVDLVEEVKVAQQARRQDPQNTYRDEIENNIENKELIEETDGVQEFVSPNSQAKRLTVKEAADIVREKNNDVAGHVQSLLTDKFQEGNGVKGGIGEQVRTIAQEQLKAQEEIKNRLSQLEERPAWKRFFFGQEKDAVVAVDETLEEQDKKIEEWNELLTDPNLSTDDRLLIEETVSELEAQQELVESHFDNILGEFNMANFFKKLFKRS